ncbi:glycosyltransferase [Anaerosalibacter massiliensis]|uniref:Glycosyltransferase n=1 Tax=Anaerosalibacter massiliensis TaxID=1347392 RepID=A0A9X2S678_9FIRM|nr:glycosyltransferase [Anaerosalibacter massiliensis]MCR2045373.1 glycosyltransferase [Anaerosalibacter massiliensis]
MKVLHVITSLGSGGAEILIKESLPIMKSKGIDTDLLVLSSKNNILEDELKSKGINVYKTGVDKIYSPKQAFKIREYINKYDIVHTHLVQGQYWTAFAKMLSNSKTPLVTTEHSTSNNRRKHKLFKISDKIVYNKHNKIICISKAANENLVEWMPSIKSKVTTIYNGINLGKFEDISAYSRKELLKEVENPKDLNLILMVGRLSKPKDHKTLIRALQRLPEKFHLIFIGTGSLEDDLISLSKELGLSHRVHFLGYRNDINRIMKTVDIYVQSSYWEGFGIAALEAMASGIPVIASDVPGLSEVVKGGGVLFPKGDFNFLANIIEEICISEKRYTDIAKRCKLKSEKFSIEEMINQYINIYIDLSNI